MWGTARTADVPGVVRSGPPAGALAVGTAETPAVPGTITGAKKGTASVNDLIKPESDESEPAPPFGGS